LLCGIVGANQCWAGIKLLNILAGTGVKSFWKKQLSVKSPSLSSPTSVACAVVPKCYHVLPKLIFPSKTWFFGNLFEFSVAKIAFKSIPSVF